MFDLDGLMLSSTVNRSNLSTNAQLSSLDNLGNRSPATVHIPMCSFFFFHRYSEEKICSPSGRLFRGHPV